MLELLFAVLVVVAALLVGAMISTLPPMKSRRVRGSPVLPVARWRGEWRGYVFA